jgi:pimeloyl-ACP methyl ester carboxylesterase
VLKGILAAALVLGLCAACASTQAPYTADPSGGPAGQDGADAAAAQGLRSAGRNPVIVFFPFTGGSASDLYTRHYEASLAGLPVHVLLLDGTGSVSDYNTGPAWSATIERYEQQVQDRLQELRGESDVDTSRVILAGYSEGGDLSWALTQRHPERYVGAIVMGSRCSYRNKTAPKEQAARGFRYYFAVGENEDPARSGGTEAAKTVLDRAGVRHRTGIVQGGEHAAATPGMLSDALRFVLGGE